MRSPDGQAWRVSRRWVPWGRRLKGAMDSMPNIGVVTLSVEEYDIETFDRAPLRHRPDGKARPDGKVPAYYVRIRQVG